MLLMLRWDVSFLPGGRGKGLDNKTRRIFVWLQMFGMFRMRCYHGDINIVNIIIQHFNTGKRIFVSPIFTIRRKRKNIKKRTKCYLTVADSKFGLKLVVLN